MAEHPADTPDPVPVTIKESAYRMPWRQRLLVLLGGALLSLAVLGSVGKTLWAVIDQPDHYLRLEAEGGGWHLYYVSIPPMMPAVPGELDAATRAHLRELADPHGENWGMYWTARNGEIMRCEFRRRQYTFTGNKAYCERISGGQPMGALPALSLQAPTTWFARLPAWWLLIPALGVLFVPARAIWLHRRRERWQRYCRGCGYDLTGNQSGMCPECGLVLPESMQPPDAGAQREPE